MASARDGVLVEAKPPVLLVLSAMRQSGEAVQFALERARQAGVGMVALYVADEGIAQSAARELAMSGFMGDQPADLVAHVLLKAYRERGTDDLEQIGSAAAKAGVACETEMREGDFYDECRTYMAGRVFCEIVAIRRKRSHLSRYLFGSVIRRLRTLRTEPFTVFTEEEP
jgi:nucleotide-binding universal stress UspA family protein